MKKNDGLKSFLTGVFSALTIGALTALTYKTTYGIFLITSFTWCTAFHFTQMNIVYH